MSRRAWVLASLLVLVACKESAPESGKAAPVEPAGTTTTTTDPSEGDESESGDPLTGEAAHVIPFADRTSMGYLLLLPPGETKPEAPTRDELESWVRLAFPDQRGGELDLLLTLIHTEPHATDAASALGELDVPTPPGAESGTGTSTGEAVRVGEEDVADAYAKLERQRIFDLIGLEIALLSQGVGDEALIPTAVLQDEILTRALTPEARASLPGRSHVLLLRADYRNQHGVRGLRLLQTLVRVVAERTGALIHDPDTLETLDLETFERRRLRVSAGNVADQLAIVPFDDPAHPGSVRLTTRGMRRFGAVDVELGSLPAEPVVLQQATDMLAGLALALVREGEVDASGFAVEVPDELEITAELMRQSYGERQVPTCSGCPGSVLVHLVERPPVDTDPRGHVVARVVAPRPSSDAADYDHPQWVRGALERLFGTASGATPLPKPKDP